MFAYSSLLTLFLNFLCFVFKPGTDWNTVNSFDCRQLGHAYRYFMKRFLRTKLFDEISPYTYGFVMRFEPCMTNI